MYHIPKIYYIYVGVETIVMCLLSISLMLEFDPLKLPPLSLLWDDLLATLVADKRLKATGEGEQEELLFGGGK